MANSSVIGLLRILLSMNTADFETAAKRSSDTMKALTSDLKRSGQQLTNVGSSLTKAFTIPIAGVGVAVAKLAMDFESSFAGVRKTVNATEPEFVALAQQFRNLSKQIPINVNEINRLGEAAGALGIPKERIADFTRVMALLGVTTNLTSDQAAESIAKIQNIFGAAGKDTDRFASTLVALGNDGASTETQIVEMATRIAGAGHAINLTQGEVLAFASALSSVGIEAEMGGSAISRVFIDIASAVSHGGEEITGFAKVANMSVAEFTKLFQTDAAQAINAFIVGLGRVKSSGGDLLGTLQELGFSEIRVRDTLLRTAGAGDLLTRALQLQRKAWEENSALTNEANERFKTTHAQLTLLWNRFKDVGITIGNALLPMIKSLVGDFNVLLPFVEEVAKLFAMLPGPVQAIIVGLGAMVAAAGPVVYVLGQLLTSASTVTAAFTKKGIATQALAADLEGLSTTSGRVAGSLGLLGKAAGVAAAGFVGWQVGRLIADLLGLDQKIADSITHLEALKRARENTAKGAAGAPAVAGQLAELEARLKVVTALAQQENKGAAAEAGRIMREIEAIKTDQTRLAMLDTINAAIKKGADANITYAGAIEFLNQKSKEQVVTQQASARAAEAAIDPSKRLREAQAQLAAANDKYAKELTGIRDALKFQIQHMGETGKTVKQLAEDYKISEDTVSRFKTELQSTTKELRKTDEETKKLLADLSGKTAIDAANHLVEALAHLPPVQTMTLEAQQRINRVMDAAIDVFEAAGRTAPKAIMDIYVATTHLGERIPIVTKLGKELQTLGSPVWVSTWTGAIPVVSGLGREFQNVGQQIAVGTGLTRMWGTEIKESLVGTLNELPSVVARSFTGSGGLLHTFASVGLMLADALLGPIMKGFKNLSLGKQAAGAIGAAGAGALGGAVAGNAGATTGSLVGMGAMALLAKAGLSGVALGAATFGIGAAAVAIVVGIQKILHNNAEWVKVGKGIGRDLGTGVSEELAKKISEVSKVLGREEATLLFLPDIINEAGGVKTFGLDLAIRKTHDLFSMLERGDLTAEQVGQTFNTLFAQILPEAIDKTTGLASANFKELIRLAHEFGVESEAVTEFMTSQATQAAAGIQTFLENATLTTQQGAEAAGATIAGAFATLRDEGLSTRDALAQLQPTIAALQEQLTKTGFSGGAAFDEIARLAAIATDKIAGPALSAVDGLASALTGAANAGFLTQDVFNGLVGEIIAQRNAILATGQSSADVNRLMQKDLQIIWQLWKDQHLAIDDTTRALLEEAEAQGVVGEQHRSIQDRLVKAIERLDDVLEAATGNATKLGDALNKIPKKIDVKVGVLTDMPDGPMIGVPRHENPLANEFDPSVFGAVEGFARGTDGFRHFDDRGEPVLLHGWEEVRTLGQARSGGSAGSNPVINLRVDLSGAYIDSEQTADRFVDQIFKRVRRGGRRLTEFQDLVRMTPVRA